MKVRGTDDIADRLFHGTDIPSLLGILSDDVLQIGIGQDGGPDGVSLTRSADVARSVADERQEQAHDDSFPMDFAIIPPGRCSGAVIELDGKKLVATGYRIRPFTWEAHHGAHDDEEQEERVLEPVQEVLRFIIAIHAKDSDLSWHANLWRPCDSRMAELFEKLRSHPLRVDAESEPAPPELAAP